MTNLKLYFLLEDVAARLASSMLMAILQRNQCYGDFKKWQMRCEALLDHRSARMFKTA